MKKIIKIIPLVFLLTFFILLIYNYLRSEINWNGNKRDFYLIK